MDKDKIQLLLQLNNTNKSDALYAFFFNYSNPDLVKLENVKKKDVSLRKEFTAFVASAENSIAVVTLWRTLSSNAEKTCLF